MDVMSAGSVPGGAGMRIIRGSPPAGTDFKDGTWHVVYPVYLDAAKTVSGGRRVSKACACDAPIVQEIAEVCSMLKLPFYVEPLKAHPRSPIDRTGRARVKIQSAPGGGLINESISTKKQLLREVGKTIPLLESRKRRKVMTEADLLAKINESTSGSQSSSAASVAKKKGKKGRKKGKK